MCKTLSLACKLRADFHLDIFTVVLILDYLIRIELLERQARDRRCRREANMYAEDGVGKGRS